MSCGRRGDQPTQQAARLTGSVSDVRNVVSGGDEFQVPVYSLGDGGKYMGEGFTADVEQGGDKHIDLQRID